MGADKTIVVGSSGGVYEPLTAIEVSQDNVNWSPIATFTGPGLQPVLVACAYMRMNISRFIDGTVPVVDVGAASDTVNLATLAVTAGNGSAASTNTSALGLQKTVQIAGAFGGSVNIDVSEDGGSTWATALTFISGGPTIQSQVVAAELMRVTRVGVPVVSPGLPTVIVGAVSGGGGGGGGGSEQAFQYTVLGTEPDLTELTIVLPSARGNANYLVFPSQADCAFLLGMNVVGASRTLTQFVLSLAAPATAGDVFSFFITDPQ